MAVLAMRVPLLWLYGLWLCVLTMAALTMWLYLLKLWPSSCKPYAFQVYLRSIARKHVQGKVNAADIEKDVARQFGIDLTGKLAELQEPMDKSRVCTQPIAHPSVTRTLACCHCALYGRAHFLR